MFTNWHWTQISAAVEVLITLNLDLILAIQRFKDSSWWEQEFLPNLLFDVNAQMLTCWWHWRKSQGMTRVVRVHPLGTVNDWKIFMAVCSVVIETSLFGPKCQCMFILTTNMEQLYISLCWTWNFFLAAVALIRFRPEKHLATFTKRSCSGLKWLDHHKQRWRFPNFPSKISFC